MVRRRVEVLRMGYLRREEGRMGYGKGRAEQSEQIIKQIIIENTRIEQLLFHLPTNKHFRNNHNT